MKAFRIGFILILVLALTVSAFAYAEEPATQIFFGQEVDVNSEEIIFKETKFKDADELRAFLKNFPNLKRIELGITNISNEELDQIRSENDEFVLVWTMKFMKFKVKTDATAFSSLHATGDQYFSSSVFDCLKYCTNLYALDLGHNRIDDLSFLENMTELRYLILADNRLTDISALANLKELQYLELFMNYSLADLSPLSDLENLVDLNIALCHSVTDYTIFETMPQLERLWFSTPRLRENKKNQEMIASYFDNCETNFKTTASTGEGWREHPHYFIIRDTFKSGVYIPFEDTPNPAS